MTRLVCDLAAIGTADRPRYASLVRRLRSALHDRRDVPEGYRYRVDGGAFSLVDAAEWMTMERRCCPFLTLEISCSGEGTDWFLTMTGPDGVKDLLRQEFPWNNDAIPA